MKRLLSILLASAAIGLVVAPAHATLIDRGADSLGHHLIYDSDLSITWYDYTQFNAIGPWQSQMDWANALSVNFGGSTYNDWRLPTVLNQACYGYNCTDSEMGHLYYTELGNPAGNPAVPMAINIGPFTNLQSYHYWSGTENSSLPGSAWDFNFNLGSQMAYNESRDSYALAVRDGDVAGVPEPGTMMLLGSGLAGLVAFRKRFGL